MNEKKRNKTTLFNLVKVDGMQQLSIIIVLRRRLICMFAHIPQPRQRYQFFCEVNLFFIYLNWFFCLLAGFSSTRSALRRGVCGHGSSQQCHKQEVFLRPATFIIIHGAARTLYFYDHFVIRHTLPNQPNETTISIFQYLLITIIRPLAWPM